MGKPGPKRTRLASLNGAAGAESADLDAAAFDPSEPELSFARQSSGARRKSLGQFFTPPAIAELMCDWALAGEPRNLLDPAVGPGVLVRAAPELDPVLRDAVGYFGLAVERAIGRSVSAIVQYQVGTPMLRGFGHRELDWPASNLLVGAAGTWGDSWRWNASFQEDVPADTPAIDFTLALSVSRRWR